MLIVVILLDCLFLCFFVNWFVWWVDRSAVWLLAAVFRSVVSCFHVCCCCVCVCVCVCLFVMSFEESVAYLLIC